MVSLGQTLLRAEPRDLPAAIAGPAQVLDEAQELYGKVLLKAAEHRAKNSLRSFTLALDRGEMVVEYKPKDHPLVYSYHGKMTQVKIGETRVPVVRVAIVLKEKIRFQGDRYRPTNHIAIVYIPQDGVEGLAVSKHFLQFVASQQVDGGQIGLRDESRKARTERAMAKLGIRQGRDVMVFVGHENPKTGETDTQFLDYHERPNWWTYEGMIASYRSTVVQKNPIEAKGSIVLGIGCTIAQAAVAACFNLLGHAVDNRPIDFRGTGLSAAYSAFYGFLAPETRRYFGRGSRFEILVKSTVSSMSFAVLLKSFTVGGISNFTYVDWGMILGNWMMGLFGKEDIRLLIEMKQELRDEKSMTSFRLPLIGEISVKSADFFTQKVALGLFAIKFMDLTNMGVPLDALGLSIPFIGDSLLIGSLALYTRPIWMKPLLVYFARKWQSRRLSQVELLWANTKNAMLSPLRLPLKLVAGCRKFFTPETEK